MRKLCKSIKAGPLRMMVYLVLFSFSFFALIPRVADATVVVDQKGIVKMDRDQDMAKIRSVLERKEVKSRLESFGMSTAEVEKRLSLLSDQDIHKLAQNLDALNPAGDSFLGLIIGLLLIAALVIVILYYTGNLNWKVKVEKKEKEKEKGK